MNWVQGEMTEKRLGTPGVGYVEEEECAVMEEKTLEIEREFRGQRLVNDHSAFGINPPS